MVMGGLITCIKRRKQKEIHSKKLYKYVEYKLAYVAIIDK